MKILSLILFIGVLCLNLSAQKVVELSESLVGIEKTKLEFEFADSISIQEWNKNEIYIKAIVNINNNADNENFVFNSEKFSDRLTIESEIRNLEDLGVDKKVKDLETGEIIEINCHIKLDIYFEVFLPKSMDISLETISGDIKVLGLIGNQKLNTISGNIDYSLLEKLKADIELSTISGEMYTDFDFVIDDKGYYHYGHMNFTHKLNGGGSDISLETISGNIYLRKAR